MSSIKRITAVAITVAALSAGSIGVASAHDAGAKGAVKATLLADLVEAGTITQAQSDAITKKFDEFKAPRDANKAANRAAMDAQRLAKETLIATTIGVDAATIKTRLAAGESLAVIAGAKKSALIAALVAFETKEIDARVTAGTLTAAQATTLKANLTAHVTAHVDAVGGKGMGYKGGKGMGKGHRR